MLEDRSSPCSLKGLCSLCLPKGLIDLFCPILQSSPFPVSTISTISHTFFSHLILYFWKTSFCSTYKTPSQNKKAFPIHIQIFLPDLFISSHPFLPSPSHQLPLSIFPTPNWNSKITLSLCHPSPPVDSALPFPLLDFSSFLRANSWQRSPWLYVFIVIKLGQSPFAGTKSKWHSLAHVHTAKLSSSHNRMALSFLPIGNSPWQVLLSEPCPDIVSQSTP